MGMTMSQKILAAHAGVESVKPGQLIMADLDLCLGNDITTPVAINEFEKAGFDAVFDKVKIALVMDHFAPKRILRRLSSANSADSLPLSIKLRITMTWVAWAWSTPCCRSRAW